MEVTPFLISCRAQWDFKNLLERLNFSATEQMKLWRTWILPRTRQWFSVPCSEQTGPWGWWMPVVWQHLQPRSRGTMFTSLRTWKKTFPVRLFGFPSGQGQVFPAWRFLSPKRSLALASLTFSAASWKHRAEREAAFPDTIQLPKRVIPPQYSCSPAWPRGHGAGAPRASTCP